MKKVFVAFVLVSFLAVGFVSTSNSNSLSNDLVISRIDDTIKKACTKHTDCTSKKDCTDKKDAKCGSKKSCCKDKTK